MSCNYGGERMYHGQNIYRPRIPNHQVSHPHYNHPEQYMNHKQPSYTMVNGDQYGAIHRHHGQPHHDAYTDIQSHSPCICFCHEESSIQIRPTDSSYSRREDYTTLNPWTNTQIGDNQCMNDMWQENGMWSTASLGNSSTSEELSTRTRPSPSSPDRPIQTPTTNSHENVVEFHGNVREMRDEESGGEDGGPATSGPWTKAESEELLRHYNDQVRRFPEAPIKWSNLGRLLSRRRTGTQCQARYSEALNPLVVRGRWTPVLDRQLMQLADRFKNSWTRVSASLPGKTQRQCRSRWVALNRRH